VTVDEDFARYVQQRMPALLRFGYALTGDPHEAEDLVQDALERAGVRWKVLTRTGEGPDAYVRRIMANRRISRWRRRRRETLVAEVPDRGQVGRDPLEGEPLWQALRQLPLRQRTVIVLRYYEDCSEAEIAAVLGVSAGTVKSQAAKARAHLRELLALDPIGGAR